jgi:hypothetical protein
VPLHRPRLYDPPAAGQHRPVEHCTLSHDLIKGHYIRSDLLSAVQLYE